jgi:alkylation response protein AidB-like acyl-CoA dehydrogenase
MSYREIDLNLTDEQLHLRDTLRRFGAEVLRPTGIALDKLADPAEVIADGSVLWDCFKKFRGIGLHKMGVPEQFGGMLESMDPGSRYLVGEEMGYADAGLAISLGASGLPFSVAGALAPWFPDKKFLQDFLHEYLEDGTGKVVGCWAITEPDHGSDWILNLEEPTCGPSLRGVLRGDRYVINGQKAAWVSNGNIATHAMLHVGLQPEKGMKGQGLALIKLDLPGISRGKPLDKMGQRPLNQGEIIFEEVEIPQENMVLTPDMMESIGMQEKILAQANGGMAGVFAGLAKAAFDEAYAYAKERVQGGVPIIQHQNIKLKLFRMFTMVEASRAAARRMSLYNAENKDNPTVAHAVACKILSTQTAFETASEAIQIFGGNGLSKEYPVEKMFRDARASMIEDGVNEVLAIGAMDYMEK